MKETTVQPLAISVHAPKTHGMLHCFSLYQKAINLLTTDGMLLTLQPYGSGLSPMSWLLRQRDFAALLNLLTPYTPITLSCDGLVIKSSAEQNYHQQRIAIPTTRILTLQVPCYRMPNADYVAQQFQQLSAPTGLFGCLDTVTRRPLSEQLEAIIFPFISLFNAKTANWQPILGLGPGLTPSCDDTIIAMLAVFFADPRTAIYFKKDHLRLFSDLTYLQTLTTTVSANYLYHAGKGHFSTTLINIISKLQRTKNSHIPIERLITHGHTSGSDALLGIWLATLVIDRYFSNK